MTISQGGEIYFGVSAMVVDVTVTRASAKTKKELEEMIMEKASRIKRVDGREVDITSVLVEGNTPDAVERVVLCGYIKPAGVEFCKEYSFQEFDNLSPAINVDVNLPGADSRTRELAGTFALKKARKIKKIDGQRVEIISVMVDGNYVVKTVGLVYHILDEKGEVREPNLCKDYSAKGFYEF